MRSYCAALFGPGRKWSTRSNDVLCCRRSGIGGTATVDRSAAPLRG